MFLGLAIYALRTDFGAEDPLIFLTLSNDDYRLFFITVLILALVFSQGVSYLRARGEGLGVFIRSGVMTRPERVVLLGIGLLAGQIIWILLAIAVVSCFTLFQRMFTIRHELEQAG